MDEDEYFVELLEHAAGEPPSAGDARALLRPRIRRAHRRRAAVRGGAGLVALVVVGGLVSSTTTHPSRDVRVGGSGTTAAVETTSVPVAPSTTLPATPGLGASDSPGPSSPTGDVRGSGGSAARGAGGGAAAPAAAPVATVNAAPGVRPTVDAPHAAVTSSPAAATSAPPAQAGAAPQVTSFGVRAGSVEVMYTETSMSVSEILPSPGWLISETKSDPASIQVTFTQESGEEDDVAVDVHLDGGKPVADDPADASSGLAGS